MVMNKVKNGNSTQAMKWGNMHSRMCTQDNTKERHNFLMF
jgi:hypothetical protein